MDDFFFSWYHKNMYCSIKRLFYDRLKGKGEETPEIIKRTGWMRLNRASIKCVFYRFIVNTVRRSGKDLSLR